MLKIKVLGVVTAAAMAVTLIVAAGAGASPGFMADETPASIQGTAYSEHRLVTNLGTMECETNNLAGTLVEPVHALTVVPSFSGCSLSTGSALTVYPGECRLSFHVDEVDGTGTVDIGPAGCGQIKIVMGGCEQKILPQTALASVSYENVGEGSQKAVIIDAQLSGIDYQQNGFLCGGSGTFTNGIYVGAWQVSASPGGFSVVEELPVGVFVAGGAEPRIDAEKFPITLIGSQNTKGSVALTTDVGTVSCDEASFEGPQSSAAASVPLAGAFAGCYLTGTGLTVTVNPNGCQYVFEASSSSAGGLRLQCPSGQAMTVSGPGCTITVPAQQLGSLAYQNQGSAYHRKIEASLSGKGISYSTKGFMCGTAAKVNGSSKGVVTLRGQLQ